MHNLQTDCVTAGLLLLLADELFEVPSWIVETIDMDTPSNMTVAEYALVRGVSA